MAPKDLYAALGVSKDASQEEIRKAYRKLARKHHPDVNPGDKTAEDTFKEVSAAYEVLSDPEKRQVYDEFGEDAEKIGYDPEKAKEYREWRERARRAGGGPGGGFGGFDVGDFGDEGFGFDIGDLFRNMRGGGGGMGGMGRQAAGPEPGADVTAEMTVSFREAARGAERRISLKKPVACDFCNGRGTKQGTACDACGGRGHADVARGPLQFRAPCGSCGGTGEKPCKKCGGSAQTLDTVQLTVKIPAGVSEGQKLRLSGQGAPGRRGGPAGDLYVTVHVEPHPVFERDGRDLELDLPITVREALLGGEVDVPTLDGTVKMKIPAGSQSGRRLRLRGKGIAGRGGDQAGDQYVRLLVKVPDASKDEGKAKEAAEALDALYDGDVRAELQRKAGS